MRRPSGDQEGVKSSAGLMGEAGDAGAVGVHHVDLTVPVAYGWNAMRRPSGDQVGGKRLSVRRVTPEPSAFIT